MTRPISVMIVDDSAEMRLSIRMLLEGADDVRIVAEADSGLEALKRLAVLPVDVVLMDIHMPEMDGVEATERIGREYPGCAVIILSVQNDVEYVRRSMRAGARDYLFKPVTGQTLLQTIRSVCETERDRHVRQTVAVLEQRAAHRPRAVVFSSAKGGVGKTTLVVNTAVALARQGKSVVIVDFDLSFGDAALFLNLEPLRTLADLARESGEIDPDVLSRYLVPHASGVYLLAAPKRPEEGEYVQSGHVRAIIQSLRRRFDFVLADTPPGLSDVFFTLLEVCDDWYMVSTLNLAVLKNNRLLRELVAELGYDTAQVRHLVNRVQPRSGLKMRDVAKVLQADVWWELADDPAEVTASINEGTPFVLRDPQGRLARQVYLLTARMEDERGERLSRRNPLRRLMPGR